MLRVGTPLGMNSLQRARLILMATAFLRLRTDLMTRAGVIVAFTKLTPGEASEGSTTGINRNTYHNLVGHCERFTSTSTPVRPWLAPIR